MCWRTSEVCHLLHPASGSETLHTRMSNAEQGAGTAGVVPTDGAADVAGCAGIVGHLRYELPAAGCSRARPRLRGLGLDQWQNGKLQKLEKVEMSGAAGPLLAAVRGVAALLPDGPLVVAGGHDSRRHVHYEQAWSCSCSNWSGDWSNGCTFTASGE